MAKVQLPTFFYSARQLHLDLEFVKKSMTQAAPYSDYFYRLDGKMKARYCDKIACIRNEDPYTMKKNEFTKDMAQLPTLG